MKGITLASVSLANPKAVPVGVLSIAAVLEREGRRVAVRDCAAPSYGALDPDSLAAAFGDGAAVLGVGCMSDTLPFVLPAIERWKRAHPEATVVLGGPGPSGDPRGIVETFPCVDIVVAGEGELTMAELASCLEGGDREDLEHVRGIAYRRGGETRVTEPRERISDLDSLPMPLYERVRMEEYPLVNIVFSRGCPYRCTFCDVAPLWGRRQHRRSAAAVAEEMAYLSERFGTREFEFTDETFVLKREAVLDFCRIVRAKGIDASWSCTGRVNLVDDALLEELAASGCSALFFGIESGSDAVLDRIRKEFSISEAIETLRAAAARMHVVASFIWGFPFETRRDLADTLVAATYLSQIGVDTRLNRLAPFSLSPIFREHEGRLRRFDEGCVASGAEPFQLPYALPEARELVERHPGLFPGFYWFETEGLEEKLRTIRSLERYRLRDAWPRPPAIDESPGLRA